MVSFLNVYIFFENIRFLFYLLVRTAVQKMQMMSRQSRSLVLFKLTDF